MWIDRVLELSPGERLVAIKNVSLAEDHLHDHFPTVRDQSGRIIRSAQPIMPASLIIEGMAQTAGILVGHAEDFKQKVILAKVSKARLDRDATPGMTLKYTADIRHLDLQGASTTGVVEIIDHAGGSRCEQIGQIDLMFSHLDQNIAGIELPEHNFVFGDSFKTLLRTSGVTIPD